MPPLLLTMWARGRRGDAERAKAGPEEVHISVALLSSETEEREEDECGEGHRPERDGELDLQRRGVVDVERGDEIGAVEMVVGVGPGDPREDVLVVRVGEHLEDGEREGDDQLGGGEEHQAEVAVDVEARGVRVEELVEGVAALEEETEGHDHVYDGDQRDNNGPHEDERVRRWDIVGRLEAADSLDDVEPMALHDYVCGEGEMSEACGSAT